MKKLRTRWVGTSSPGSFCFALLGDHELPIPEKWAVYVFQLKGPVKPYWVVVGRLLQRPWSRVGGETPRYHFDSLGAARKCGERMAGVLCPNEQSRRDFPFRVGCDVRSEGHDTDHLEPDGDRRSADLP
jgi:hypothetical protein